jgi:hypothetical protein
MRGVSKLLGFKMISDPVNNLQIYLFEGPGSLVNFAPSRIGDRLTSNLSTNSASVRRSPGLKTSSRIASRTLLITRKGAFSVSWVSLAFLGAKGWRIGVEFSLNKYKRSPRRSSK